MVTAIMIMAFSIMWSSMVSAQEGDWSGNINLFGGQKSLNKDDWSDDLLDLSIQNEFGIKIDFRQEDWPASIAIDYLYSSADDSGSGTFFDPFLGTFSGSEKVKGEISELHLGLRGIVDLPSPIRPFIGGGACLFTAKQSVDLSVSGLGSFSDSDTDNTVGVWFEAGIYATLAEHYNIGVDFAYSEGTVTLFDESTKVGGFHYGLLAGYHW